MKRAMITIEVLIAMLILFLVIATSVSNIKFFNTMIYKKESYEARYVAFLSIKDRISDNICRKSYKLEGKLDGFSYSATCKKIKEMKNYVIGMELNDPSGNIGDYMINLYNIKLKLKKGRVQFQNSYLKMRYQKIVHE